MSPVFLASLLFLVSLAGVPDDSEVSTIPVACDGLGGLQLSTLRPEAAHRGRNIGLLQNGKIILSVIGQLLETIGLA